MHPKRPEIEKALIAGTPERRIAQDFGVNRNSVQSHRQKHMKQVMFPPASIRARRKKTLHREKLKKLMEEAGRKGDYGAAARFAELIAEHDRQEASERLQSEKAESQAQPFDNREYVAGNREVLGYTPEATRRGWRVVEEDDFLKQDCRDVEEAEVRDRICRDLSFLLGHYLHHPEVLQNEPGQAGMATWFISMIEENFQQLWEVFNAEQMGKP